MHYLVRLIVKADSATDALENADSYAQELVERGDFDWYDMNGRWGKSKAVRLSTETGTKMLIDAMQTIRNEFSDNINTVRYMLNTFTNEQIFNNDYSSDEGKRPENVGFISRYSMGKAGNGQGYIYSESYGGSIDSQKDLDFALKGENLKSLWVISVDFHN